MTPSAPRRGPQWSRLHHHESSTSSPDRSSSVDSHASPRSQSTQSTIREPPAPSRERYCTITVNDGYLKDEVLLNFDRLGADARPYSLMAITSLKGDSAKPSTGYGSMSKAPAEHKRGRAGKGFSLLDQDCISRRYVFIAKDMSKEMKSRHPDVDVSVSRHIADAFGMKKGAQVILAPVGHPSPPNTTQPFPFPCAIVNRGGLLPDR
jgi:hypothetical protein